MNNILVIIAVIGIGYLLYRSLVIKRQPNQDDTEQPNPQQTRSEQDSVSLSSQPGEPKAPQSASAEVTTARAPAADTHPQAESSEAGPAPADESPSQGSRNEVGTKAAIEAEQAVTKAAEKAHMEKAQTESQSKLERQANAGLASDKAPPVPAEVQNQVQALAETNDELARHRLYQQIVEQSYKQRNEDKSRQALFYFAQAHIDEFDSIKAPLQKQNGGKLPQVATFKHFAAALAENGQYDEAIAVCEKALSYELKDGTKTGYQGRIERIQKLKAKAEG